MDTVSVGFFTGHRSPEVRKYYMNLTPGGTGRYGRFQFSINEWRKDYDYVVVFESIDKDLSVSIDKDRLIFIAGEASSIRTYNSQFLAQFGHVITCQNQIVHQSKHLRSPGHTWFSQKTYDELMQTSKVDKTRLLSIVCSNKSMTKGHRDRFKSCKMLKEALGEKADLYGRGFNEFDDKWDVIAPYKYSIAIENAIEDHWITEKLGDCYTSHTFPFYMGAPNVDQYYDHRSYASIDIRDFEESLKIITTIIEDPCHYERHAEYLSQAKYHYLNKHSVIPMISDFIKDCLFGSVNKDMTIVSTISPEDNGILNKLKRRFTKV